MAFVVVAALAATGVVLLAQPAKTIMGSTAVEWNSVRTEPTPTGFRRKFFEAPTATLETLECHVTTLNPGDTSHPAHQHPEEEVLIIKEGTVEVLINGEWKRVGPGSVVFMASNVPHGLRNVGDVPATYHVVMWRSATTPRAQPREKE
jgi:XRE family transcriptional regulator, regulator of sulfur utilization